MTAPAPGPAGAVTDRWRRWRLAGHALAAGVVVAGVVAAVARPTAPAISSAPPATTWFDPDFLAVAEAYRAPREVAAVLAVAVRVAVALALAASPPGRRVVAAVAARLGDRPWLAAAAVAGAAVVVLDVALAPIAWWIGYLHDGAYGLRTQGLGGWMVDWVARRAPGWVGAVVLAGGGYGLARRCPRGWPPLAALAGAALVAAMVMVGPLLLEPLLHRTTPLGPGPTRAAVHEVGAAAGVDVGEVVVADASRRTVRQNAYVSGLGATRRVVLYDTLLAARAPDEIRTLVAHELAHHEHRDIERGVLTGAAAVVAGVYGLAAWLRRRVRRGRQHDAADPASAGVVVGAVLLALVLTMPVQHALSRRMEAAADWRALELTGDPDGYEQLKRSLATTNLTEPDPPAWRHWWWGSHPTTVERLWMAERWRREASPPDQVGPGSG